MKADRDAVPFITAPPKERVRSPGTDFVHGCLEISVIDCPKAEQFS